MLVAQFVKDEQLNAIKELQLKYNCDFQNVFVRIFPADKQVQVDGDLTVNQLKCLTEILELFK